VRQGTTRRLSSYLARPCLCKQVSYFLAVQLRAPQNRLCSITCFARCSANKYAICAAGLAGSVLEERINRTEVSHWYCAKKVDDWQTVWRSRKQARMHAECMYPAAISPSALFVVFSTKHVSLHPTVRQTLTLWWRLQVWLSLQSASRPDCFLDELQVFYDKSTGR